MSNVTIRHSRRFGIVADRILENKDITLEARAVAAWLTGRQDGFVIRVEAMKNIFLGLSDKRWKSVRIQLERIGWWRSTKIKTPNGKYVWSHEFCDEGFCDVVEQRHEITIPPQGSDGERTDAAGKAAGNANATVTDYHQDVNHQEDNQTTTTVKPYVVESCDIDALVDAAVWQQQNGGKPIANLSAWRQFVRRRIMSHGPNAEDIDTLDRWREATALKKCGATSVAVSHTDPIFKRTEADLKKLSDALKEPESAKNVQGDDNDS